MQLQPRAERPDPELWRAVYNTPAAHLTHHAGDADGWASQPHGMPADRLAMAASRQPLDTSQRERLG